MFLSITYQWVGNPLWSNVCLAETLNVPYNQLTPLCSGFSWSFCNSHLTSMHEKPFELLPRSLLPGLDVQIPLQNPALQAETMHGLKNSCADCFCTKPDSIFLRAVGWWQNPKYVATGKCGTKCGHLNLGQEARAHQGTAKSPGRCARPGGEQRGMETEENQELNHFIEVLPAEE